MAAIIIGQSVGRYHITEQLGEGGMATVFVAFDTRLERYVALKVIRSRQSHDPSFVKRFEREARVLARLSHPAIVSVYDYGEHDGQPYLVMEYLPGDTLKKLTGAPMPFHQAARLLVPIAQALDYAHRQNIIHRDVKPANILLTESGAPTLSDFGIARILETDYGAELTGTGVGIGTPEYMAPEQWLGKVEKQTDIYALGVVFFELVTCRRPYIADTPAAVLLKQATEPLPRPSQFVADLPERVEQVIFKALARDVDERYATAVELAGALQQLAEMSVTAAPVTQTRTIKDLSSLPTNYPINPTVPVNAHQNPAKEASRRSPWLWVVIGLGCLALIGVTVGLLAAGKLAQSSSTVQVTPTAPAAPGKVDVTLDSNPAITVAPTAAAVPVIKAENAATLSQVGQMDKKDSGDLLSLANASDGQSLAAYYAGGAVTLWDPQTLSEHKSFSFLDDIGVPCGASDIAFSPDGQSLAFSLGTGKGFRVISLNDGSHKDYAAGAGCVSNLQYAPDGQSLAARKSGEQTGGDPIEIYDAVSMSVRTPLNSGENYTKDQSSMAFSADGKWLAFYDQVSIKVWNTSDGSMARQMRSERVTALGFVPHTNLLAAGSWQSANLWNVDKAEVAQTLQGVTGTVEKVSASPDGLLLASASNDMSVMLWQVSDGALLHSFKGYNVAIAGLAFSPDGRRLATGSKDGTIQVWGLKP